MGMPEQEKLWEEVLSTSRQLFDTLENTTNLAVESLEAQQEEVQLQQLLMRRGDALFRLYHLLAEQSNAVENSKILLAELEQLNHDLGSKLYQREAACLKALKQVMEQSLNLKAYKQNELEAYRPAVLEANAFR